MLWKSYPHTSITNTSYGEFHNAITITAFSYRDIFSRRFAVAANASKDTVQNCCFSLWLCPKHQPSLLQSRRPRSGWYLWPFSSLFGCARWSVRSMNQNNQAWPTELSIAAPVVWNALLPHLCSPSISCRHFRPGLKTHLFKEAYTDNLWELSLKSDLNWTFFARITQGWPWLGRILQMGMFWDLLEQNVLQAGCPCCHPTNSSKHRRSGVAWKAIIRFNHARENWSK